MNAITDKELLELAAKAAGIELTWNMVAAHLDDYERTAVSGPFVNGVGWNPLSDDGDALRLVVTLDLNIQWHQDLSGYVVVWHGRKHGLKEDFIFVDKKAATRRAIVRAAAELGKDMK